MGGSAQRDSDGRSGLRSDLREIAAYLAGDAQAVKAAESAVTALAEALTTRGSGQGWARMMATKLGEAARRSQREARDVSRIPSKKTGLGVPLGGDSPSKLIEETGSDPANLNNRYLDEIPMLAVEVGTVSHQGRPLLLAFGITPDGQKRALALHHGHGADRQMASEIAQNLYQRGLRGAAGRMLLLTDGSPALDNAFAHLWPQATLAHCQKALLESVLAHLGNDVREMVAQELRTAFAAPDVTTAQDQIRAVQIQLTKSFPGAHEALSQGLAPALMVKRLCASSACESTLATLAVLRTAFMKARVWGNAARQTREIPFSANEEELLYGLEIWQRRTRRLMGHQDIPQLGPCWEYREPRRSARL